MRFLRKLQLAELLEKKSFFLFGPRSTGKTTLINHQLDDAKIFDLLDAKTYRDLLKQPSLLEEASDANIVVIDEIQKLPMLLDEVHRLIEGKGMRFLMTGSSARKLKRGAANLLAGRAWQAQLFPLSYTEIPGFDLMHYLNVGGLPQVYTSKYPEEELKEYVSTYLKEEVQAEALTRNIAAFSEFLDLIGLSNGNEINFQSFARDCGVSPNTIQNYLQILDDTLVGFSLPAFTETKRRKAVSRMKYYLFDIGVVNYLANRGQILPKSELFGSAFEHFIILECRAFLSYLRKNEKMTYWRSTSQFEVDLIIGNELAIEIKGTELVQDKHLKGIRAFKEEHLVERYVVVSNDPQKRVTADGIHIYPWNNFLDKLWAGEII